MDVSLEAVERMILALQKADVEIDRTVELLRKTYVKTGEWNDDVGKSFQEFLKQAAQQFQMPKQEITNTLACLREVHNLVSEYIEFELKEH